MFSRFFIICAAPVVSFFFPPQVQAQTRGEKTQATIADQPNADWWEIVDTGPFISDTFRIFGDKGEIGVLKGIAIKVGPQEEQTVVFDSETMRMVAGFDGHVILGGTAWDGRHGGNSNMPKDRSGYVFTTTEGPGWALDGDWSDPRPIDNGKPNGPLPDDHSQYLGLYRHENGTILSYTVGSARVLEKVSSDGQLLRTFEISEIDQPMEILVSDPVDGVTDSPVHLTSSLEGVEIKTLDSGRRVISIDGARPDLLFQLSYSEATADGGQNEIIPLSEMLTGGPVLFPETISVEARLDKSDGTYAVDSIPLPSDNPWESEIRFGGFDFFADGKRVACSTWNGDVWIATGIDGAMKDITWKRFASGLYQTLGLKIVDDVIHTLGRDQITKLHDLNGNGEADFYECFNNDIRITEGFHEFAFDLQTDQEGNFYFSKGMPVLGGGRGFAPWTPDNGTIQKVSRDGKTLTTMATGLRAPGGIGVGPNGELTTGENEGSYVPRCKITWSRQDGSSFHGVVPSEWEDRQFVKTLPGAPTDYERPLCWLPYYVDNSSGSQFWLPDDSPWKNHAGGMLHLSYGKSSIYGTIIDEVDGQVQGGVYRLPIELTTAPMRMRPHPATGDLYVIGFRGWQTNGGTGFQRVRFQEAKTPVPTRLEAHKNGLIISFSDPVDEETASDARRYAVSKWDYVWGPQYGSGRFSIDDYDDEARAAALVEPSKGSQNRIDSVTVRAATVLAGGQSVFLYIPEMTPAMQMEIKMDLATRDGTEFRETIWNTIHNLRPVYSDHGLDLTNLPEINTEPIGETGLILSMAHGSTDDALIVDRLAMTLGEGDPMSPFIDPNRGSEVVFESSLFVETRDDLAFKLEGRGWASFKLDGETILEGELPLESAPFTLEAGPHQLFCNFRRKVKGAGKKATPLPGRIQLLWSGKDFVWEPVKPSAFRYLPSDLVDSKDKTRHGRELFASQNCIACHEAGGAEVNPERAMPELFERAPEFANIGNRLHQSWVEQWVRKPQEDCPSVAPDDAAHIAAYLATKKDSDLTGQQGNREKGAELVSALHLSPWLNPMKKEAKFTEGGLVQFLQDPSLHHAATSFPTVRLSDEEASDLAAWILAEVPEHTEATIGDPQLGEKIVSQRCYVCHGEPGEKFSYEFPAKPLKQMWDEEWLVHGCLSEEEGKAPELGLTLEEKQALLAFRNVDSSQGFKSLNRFVAHEYATRTIKKLDCASCHSGENELPNIDLAGEKLRDEWLAGLFHGDVLSIRPYEKARMPAFPSRAKNLAHGLAQRAGVPTGIKVTAPDEAHAEAGAKVAGMTGYACTTCHAAGSQGALQAFEGQGPNLQLSGERLREDYYMAWMHWPQRFIPTTIMPKYAADKTTALNPTFFDGNAYDQFDAVWEWMKTLDGAENAPVGESH